MTPLSLLDNVQDFFKETIAPNVPPEAITGIIFIVVLANLYLLHARSRGGEASSSGVSSSKPIRSGGSKDGNSEPRQVKDIFSSLRRRKKSADGATSGKKAHTPDKPFGSSYYYAHNHPSAKGGYKDGLSAEDYVMNKPRLLSKGGKAVDEEEEGEVDIGNEGENQQLASKEVGNDKVKSTTAQSMTREGVNISPISVPINRYMWDDNAGDNLSGVNEVAKIYIDSLPSKLSTGPPIKWEESGITKSDVEANLVGSEGKGLLIQIRRPNAVEGQPTEYHLYMPRMFGTAEKVKAVVKSKRLLVKIQKRRSRLNPWGKTNLKPWPQLGEKPVGSNSGSTAAGGDTVDEDLFKRELDPAMSGGFDEGLFSKGRNNQ